MIRRRQIPNHDGGITQSRGQPATVRKKSQRPDPARQATKGAPHLAAYYLTDEDFPLRTFDRCGESSTVRGNGDRPPYRSRQRQAQQGFSGSEVNQRYWMFSNLVI